MSLRCPLVNGMKSLIFQMICFSMLKYLDWSVLMQSRMEAGEMLQDRMAWDILAWFLQYKAWAGRLTFYIAIRVSIGIIILHV